MSENDEFKRFLHWEEIERDRIVYEVPSEIETPPLDKIPNGYDPMGRIYLEGRAYRGLSARSSPWWVLITGWFIFGIIFFTALIPIIMALTSGSWIMLIPALIIVSPFLVIMWRSTSAKLSAKNNQNRRY